MEDAQGTAAHPIKADFENSLQPDHHLEKLLQREPFNFAFFQALRRLECLHEDKPRFGAALKCQQEPVRLGQNPSMAFAPGSLSSFEIEEETARLQVNFFGLLGPNGPLPLHLTEYIYDRLHNHGDSTLSRFLDIFHHRLLCFFYRVSAQAQPAVSFDRPQEDRFGDYLASLMGLGTSGLQNRNVLPDRSKLYFTGVFANQRRNAEGLQNMLSDYLSLPVAIEEFVGKWVPIPEEYLFVLGDNADTASLGETMLLGSETWTVDETLRIIIGPVNLADFQRLQPGGRSLTCVAEILRQYLGDEMQWEIKVVLQKKSVPAFELGYFGDLSRSIWLYSDPPEADVEDLIIESKDLIPS